MYGTKEFLPFIKQTGDGHIINISSLFGLTAQPTQSAYNATKFAVRGFTESLRQELDLENCGVSALSVHPGGIRTNIANNAKMNDSIRTLGMNPEKSARAFNKLLRCPPEEAARQILEAVQKDKRRLLIGNDAKTLDLIQRIVPTGYQKKLPHGRLSWARNAVNLTYKYKRPFRPKPEWFFSSRQIDNTHPDRCTGSQMPKHRHTKFLASPTTD